jgi:hypothetical protein
VGATPGGGRRLVAAFSWLWPVVATTACTSGIGGGLDGEVVPGTDASSPALDVRPDSSAPETAAGDATPAASPCVADPSSPPLEAIKRLATTTDEVRILVYGQSISEQVWWQQVRDWLRTQYPRGNLVMEQHARGGCAAQCLVGREAWSIDGQTMNRVPGDVFAFAPHLVIFNVYGRHDDYEYLVKGFRQGCGAFDDHPVASARCRAGMRYPGYQPAEVLIQTSHRVDDLSYTTILPAVPPIPDGQWEYWMSTVWVPMLARKYGTSLVHVWEGWGEYLQANKLAAAALLADDIHLNERGNELMAELTRRSLCWVPPR